MQETGLAAGTPRAARTSFCRGHRAEAPFLPDPLCRTTWRRRQVQSQTDVQAARWEAHWLSLAALVAGKMQRLLEEKSKAENKTSMEIQSFPSVSTLPCCWIRVSGDSGELSPLL